MSWRFKNCIQEDEEDEKYLNQQEEAEGDLDAQDGEDPLDAFMNELKQQKCAREPSRNQGQLQAMEVVGQDEEQNQEGRKNQGQIAEDYYSGSEGNSKDEDRNRKIIEPLKPFDFSKVQLQKFEKDFYKQHEDIANMSPELFSKFIKQHQIKITGAKPLKPVISFGHLPLTERMLKIIRQLNFQHPTPIQAQALPCALSGRDVVGIAKTGSGKTLAFVWPMIIHVNRQRSAKKGEGPIALILAPTRELCQQIYVQARRYARKESIKIDCILGGENKHEQWKSLKAGTDILIASPGRLIEFIRKKATNLMRVTYLVLDEADRMLSLGFQQQIRSIVAQTRPDRQTLLFTATMKKNMQLLVGDIVTEPLRIIVGDQDAANEDVQQEVVVIKEEQEKIDWLESHLPELMRQGKILIFANQRMECEDLGRFIEQVAGVPVLVLHGDKNQYDRTVIMNSFKAEGQILVATEIAARGIDVKNIKTVINFQCPKTIEAYIHRIGRAGRAGETGTAYTFLTNRDIRFAISLVGVFENSGYPVPEELEELAMLDDVFRRRRVTSKMGISFAKGKDATKYLNNALKRQRKGFSRAGLGFDETTKKSEQSYNAVLNLSEQAEKMKNASISELSEMIRSRINETKVESKHGKQFIKSNADELNSGVRQPTVTYYKKKQP